MKQFATLLLVLVAFASQAQTTCVDPLACNFTESGECIYVDENGDLCVVEGCNIEGACNYDPEADLNDGSCDFESCLGCTDETACNFDAEAVYLDNSCIYYIDCNGTCGGDWIQDECGNCFAPVDLEADGEVVMTFTNCGAEGRYGPSQGDCDAEYGANQVTVVNGIQQFTIPATGTYKIDVQGARGGHSIYGQGAHMVGVFAFEEGEVLEFLVGQKGGTASSGSGGGGSFVVRSSDQEPLIIAGGGGGQYESSVASQAGNELSVGTTDLTGASGYCGSGGVGGSGGQGAQFGSGASGGGGFNSSGGNGYYGSGGASYLSGGIGGTTSSAAQCVGGFGGGGGTHGNTAGGGGGGGYSGGGAGCHDNPGYGGGGSSFLSPEGQLVDMASGVNEGHGVVVLSRVDVAPPCELGCTTLQACNYNEDATNDDGTCDYCFCGPGTEYSVEAGQCLVVEGCTDFNDDGCTGTQDLLHLLSNFGNCDE